MSNLRTGRRKYYDLFSGFYDLFIRVHSHNYGEETRKFLVDSARLEGKKGIKVLDVCCGTGSVVLSFVSRLPDILAIGYDFSHGMLLKACEKDPARRATFIEGDAADLCFSDNSFDIVCCSHALYELKGHSRKHALLEMRRVVKPGGSVLIMEHEIPRRFVIRILFHIRMLIMGPADSREFLKQGLSPFQKIFSHVSLTHTKSGKSKLITCIK